MLVAFFIFLLAVNFDMFFIRNVFNMFSNDDKSNSCRSRLSSTEFQ